MAKKAAKNLPAPFVPATPFSVSFWTALLLGAGAAMLALAFLNFGTEQIWTPFARTGGQIYKALALSALMGAIGVVAAARRPIGPQAPAACALGWGVIGLWTHIRPAESNFLKWLLPVERPAAANIFFANGPSQAICVGFGLVLAGVVAFVLARAFGPKEVEIEAKNPNLGAFSNALAYPVMAAVAGFVACEILGLALLIFPEPNENLLPMPLFAALGASFLAFVAFFGAAFFARRTFGGLGTLGTLLAAPIVVAFVCGMNLATLGQMAILRPSVALILNASPFEIAAWGAFGAALGFWAAERKK